MCWSFGASAILSVLGFFIAAYMFHKRYNQFLCIPVIYFSIMEGIQAITYFYINNCSSPMNQLLTYLGYLHIVFQPFFINMVSLNFVPKHFREKISGFVYAVCFLSAIVMLVKVYPFSWAGTCPEGTAMCGRSMCSVTGSWHLAWEIPLNGLDIGIFGYALAGFIVPLLYGAWRITSFHILFGPLLAMALSKGQNEYPAVWCLISVTYFIVFLVKPIFSRLINKKWYLWDFPFEKKK